MDSYRRLRPITLVITTCLWDQPVETAVFLALEDVAVGSSYL